MPFSGDLNRSTSLHEALTGSSSFSGSIGAATSNTETLRGILSLLGNIGSSSQYVRVFTGALGTLRGKLIMTLNGTLIGRLMFKITNAIKITIG